MRNEARSCNIKTVLIVTNSSVALTICRMQLIVLASVDSVLISFAMLDYSLVR